MTVPITMPAMAPPLRDEEDEDGAAAPVEALEEEAPVEELEDEEAPVEALEVKKAREEAPEEDDAPAVEEG